MHRQDQREYSMSQAPDKMPAVFTEDLTMPQQAWARAWQQLVALGFHLLYHQLAWTYDAVSWVVSLGAWRTWQMTVLDEVRGTAVLELGYGPGHMLGQLAAAGYEVSGIDPSPQMGRLAARRLRRAGLAARLVRGKAQTLPFADSSFDCVVATFPTDYIVDPRTLTAVYRVLKANGRLLIVPEARLTGTGLGVRLLEGLYRVTGQRSSAAQSRTPAYWGRFEERFNSAGFAPTYHQAILTGSTVNLIVCVKEVSG